MATTTFGDSEVHTSGDLPAVGSEAPGFTLTGVEFQDVTLGSGRTVLNIFPSIATGVCSASVRKFNELASGLSDTTVVCASMDLPFALAEFCGAEGLDQVVPASAFRSDLGEAYGVQLVDGKWAGLLARAVVIVGADGKVIYTELVPAIGQEPDYDSAVAALS